jgi:hypothetical protein
MDAIGSKSMSRLSWLEKQYWTRLGKPVEERELFAQLIQRPIASLLEVGIGNGSRMQRIAKLVTLAEGVASLRYVGTDEFESATDRGHHLSLKQAHRLASQLGFKATLIPGDVESAIPRVAHKLGSSDLIIIDGGLDSQQPSNGFLASWLNRIAHRDSIVLAAAAPGGTLRVVDVRRLELPNKLAA